MDLSQLDPTGLSSPQTPTQPVRRNFHKECAANPLPTQFICRSSGTIAPSLASPDRPAVHPGIMSHHLPFYWIDAFASQPFAGNPAAVCPLDTWLPDAQLQRMARQHGLPETAFLVPTSDDHHFELRWFTPAVEVDLCGHATLAAAHVLFHERGLDGDQVTFNSASGPLIVRRSDAGRLELDFPARPPALLTDQAEAQRLLAALGVDEATWIGTARDHLVVLAHQAAVAALQPDFARIAACSAFGVIATAPGNDCDFVSRFFTPKGGINEDPVTGSAHCTLVPFWADRLGQTTLFARQISARGGELWCEQRGDRVALAGNAFTYLRGEITLPQ